MEIVVGIEKVLETWDQLLHRCQLAEAEAYLTQQISQAEQAGDREALLLLRNEQIGFYRDGSRFPETLDTAERTLALFQTPQERQTISYATTLLNCANAYRAAGQQDKALAAYEEIHGLYAALLPPEDHRVASLWNNEALLYQEMERWEDACRCLTVALDLVRRQQDETRVAISCTNLAVSLLRLQQTEQAHRLLTEADGILRGKTPSDFHYSAVLAGFGDCYYQMGVYEKAAAYYEQALPEIQLHMGQSHFYGIVAENLKQAYAAAGMERPVFTGLALCRRFYLDFGEPMLQRNFPDVLPQLAVGLVGEGSECLGYADEISMDHDYGPGFCIWVPDDFPEECRERLAQAYDGLPKSYYGVTRKNSPQGENRVGVCRQGEFFQRILGMPGIPKTEADWLSLEDGMLSTAVSGEIFRDDSGEWTKKRSILHLGYPKAVQLRRLAQAYARMAQCGQYNYERMKRRGDDATAQLYLAEFCKNAMTAAHLCRRKYAPYEKWLLRSTRELSGFGWLGDAVCGLLTGTEAKPKEKIQEICDFFAREVQMEHTYLDDAAQQLLEQAQQQEKQDELVAKIVQLEWKAFDTVQNIGGRAECQDNWDTFSIMRTSQYRYWPAELLEQWIAYFEEVLAKGQNPITYKYAYMMEHTDPTEYAKFQDKLPAISPEAKELREAIIAIQIPWMEAFAKAYPTLSSRARVIHSEEDSVWETSYETYLRGELSVYPFAVLYGYGRWIVSLHQAGKNLAQMTMEDTVHAYGYESLAEAEEKGCCP